MIGFYDYTVWLTYFSLLSGSLGIIVCLKGSGHPFIGIFFLMFSGLCDTFDGKVARTKKDRTPAMRTYGIQIDSLSDLVAFGVLPPCIGTAMLRLSSRLTDIPRLVKSAEGDRIVYPVLLAMICLFYVLAAMIRLAYFNVMEEERQHTESGGRKEYLGLPVTSAALIFPSVLLFQYATAADLTLLYFGVMLATAVLFITPFRVPKPGIKGIVFMVGIGFAEFVLLLIRFGFGKR